jgi:acyl-CoA thioesterase-1
MIIMTQKIHAGVMAVALAVGCTGGDGAPAAEPARNERRLSALPARNGEDVRPSVLVLGTSLTAGLGVALEQAYPSLLQERADSAGLAFRIVNAGVSGETSAAGLRRIDWLLRQPVAVMVLELGANDGLRGLPVQQLEDNLQAIIDRTRAAHPDVVIVVAGMEAPPNLGRRYTNDFRDVYRSIAERNRARLIPFILEGVAAEEDLNQPDGIHPTPDGHRMIATTVWNILEPVLDSLATSGGRTP